MLLTAITLLGSTGSIGTSTLDVVRRWPERFRVFALAAGNNVAELAKQIVEFRPAVATLRTAELVTELRDQLRHLGLDQSAWPELTHGPQALVDIATAGETDCVMSAIVGVSGLEATYEAVCARKRIGLANKEVLVASGELVMQAAREHGTELIPVDSEHNGAHQALRAGKRSEAVKLILTASGGPFRNTPKSQFASITREQALRHPTWKMGQRITINSATLMNKGFEVIEACWLFDFSPDDIEVVVHPQSTVHAMVEYNDGSVVAQVSATDMRMPIQYALTYPERADAPVPRLSWSDARTWDFHPPDFERFPLLGLAYECQREGGSATCTLNAADEIAVAAFLENQITFPEMTDVVRETLQRVPKRTCHSVAEVLDTDLESRRVARQCVRQRAAVRA